VITSQKPAAPPTFVDDHSSAAIGRPTTTER
jgi:hypothetical protein